MSTNDNGRAEARTRANRRLRRMTIGTTMLGLAATGTLGWLAGVTDNGTTAIGAETAIVTDSTSASTGITSSTTTTSTTPATTTPTVTTTTGSGHASSGGS